MLVRRIEEVRQAKVFDLRPARTFREAATRFLIPGVVMNLETAVDR